MRNKPYLTASDVRAIMTASVAEAEKNRWEVAVAVVDDGGYLLQVVRMDGARPLSVDVATSKARTAALTAQSTRYWEELVKGRSVFLKFPENMPIGGGLPIVYKGQCVGGIGVSGVESDEDEQIASAGIQAIV